MQVPKNSGSLMSENPQQFANSGQQMAVGSSNHDIDYRSSNVSTSQSSSGQFTVLVFHLSSVLHYFCISFLLSY